jgi:uncharacterized protein (TIGR03086 family)
MDDREGEMRMPPVDLGPATQRMADLLPAITDEQLTDPTPCTGTSVAALLDHIAGFTLAFAAAARKTPLDRTASADAPNLAPDWRDSIPAGLKELAEAWRDPDAWTGTTGAGGVELPGEVAGVVALDELVLHGWDLARATAQGYDCDDPSLDAVEGFVATAASPGQEQLRSGLFGPVVDVAEQADDAPRFDRVLGLAGRDPAWSPA